MGSLNEKKNVFWKKSIKNLKILRILKTLKKMLTLWNLLNESGNIDLASFNTIKSFKAEKRCALTEKNRLDDKKNQFLVENCKNEELCNKNENLNLSAKSDKNLSLLEKRNPNLCLSEKKNKSLAL